MLFIFIYALCVCDSIVMSQFMVFFSFLILFVFLFSARQYKKLLIVSIVTALILMVPGSLSVKT